ncbi:hypothetical protein D9757_011850 [Collybiopsis confluens]|uniref:Methyltransferase type 11 domain-containing protein n=1 Tax=Collybiopsis confluens TaxID=2823264 RepID=A0A8H5D4N4_9AGAR|nr:hypothetical protein D9757_011850 [Collybiopsis confluens]
MHRYLRQAVYEGIPFHFSLHSVTDLPSEWNDTFSYAHQRLLVLALDKTLWRQAVNEIFRVLKPGGWIELVEMDFQSYQIGVGPYSSKLQSLILKMFPEKGYLLNLAENLLSILKNGFVNIQVEMRQVRVGGGEEAMECGYKSKEMATFVRALKRDVMIGNGYGFVETEEEYEELVRGAEKEWNDHPCQGSLFVIVAQKP